MTQRKPAAARPIRRSVTFPFVTSPLTAGLLVGTSILGVMLPGSRVAS